MTVTAQNRLNPSLQFLVLTALTVIVIFIGYVVGVAVIVAIYGTDQVMQMARLDLSGPNTVSALWILQTISTTIPLLIVPLVFAQFVMKDVHGYLKPSFRFPWQLWLIVFAVMLVSSPLIEFLSNINQKMVLPQSLDWLQKWMREKEDSAQKLTETLLQMKTAGSMISNVIFVGLITAIVEEAMFRGCLQTIFTRWTKNAHAAVWVTAILFSAFHFEFFGFLPRLLLGALFGYFALWSGSIWPAIWGHFINNSTAVVATYLYQNNKTKFNPDNQHVFNYSAYLFSLIIVLFLLYLYRNVATDKKPRSIS